jgi:hypothetical protein
MSWEISRLILLVWRNRLRQLFRQMPALWLLVPFGLLYYLGGAYLGYSFIEQGLQPLVAVEASQPLLATLVRVAFFNFFGLSTFMLVSIAVLFTPRETTLKRLLAPLPISPLHFRWGSLLPGMLLLFVAQGLLWLPLLLALVNVGLATPWQMALAVICGLVCYNALTLAFHEGVFYIVTRIFGRERPYLRSSAMGLSMAVGLVLLTIALILAAQALLTKQPGWLVVVPAYWMTFILEPDPLRVMLGISLLMVGALLGGGLYTLALAGHERLFVGAGGQWVPWRRLSFPRSRFLSYCLYEFKAIWRDQEVCIGLVLIVGIAIAALVGIRWSGSNALLALLLQGSLLLISVLLIGLAQLSWGRDRRHYPLLTSTPLEMRRFIDGKLCTNLAVITVCWLVLASLLAAAAGSWGTLLATFPLVWPGSLLCFIIGIVFPYSLDDPVSMMRATAVMAVLGLPLYLLYQQAQHALLQLPGGPVVHGLAVGAAVLLVCSAGYVAVQQLCAWKMEQQRPQWRPWPLISLLGRAAGGLFLGFVLALIGCLLVCLVILVYGIVYPAQEIHLRLFALPIIDQTSRGLSIALPGILYVWGVLTLAIAVGIWLSPAMKRAIGRQSAGGEKVS